MFMVGQAAFMAWLIVGTIGTVLFFVLLIIFGRLIKLQVKIWLLARRGFHLVEHIGMNKVRSYFYLRPKDNKFDFKSGFYIHYPETTTKTSSFLPPTPGGYKFLKFSELAETAEGDKLTEIVGKLVYDTNAITLRWGIPIITYVGNSPYPVNFSEPKTEYGAQVIRDVYIRLLATEQYGLMKKIIMIGLLVGAGILIALVLLYFAYKSNASNLGLCLYNLNSTSQQLLSCAVKAAGNSTIIV
jgi:hypothetical protein